MVWCIGRAGIVSSGQWRSFSSGEILGKISKLPDQTPAANKVYDSIKSRFKAPKFYWEALLSPLLESCGSAVYSNASTMVACFCSSAIIALPGPWIAGKSLVFQPVLLIVLIKLYPLSCHNGFYFYKFKKYRSSDHSKILTSGVTRQQF